MENKNTLIAFALILAIYSGYVLIFPPSSSAPKPSPAPQTAPAVEVKNFPKDTVVPPKNLIGDEKIVLSKLVAGAELAEKKIVVENELYRLVLSNVGASIEEVELKKFQVGLGGQSPNVFLVKKEEGQTGSPCFQGTGGWGFSSKSFFHFSGEKEVFSLSSGDHVDLVFKSVQNDLLIEKTYSFQGNEYPVFLNLKVSNIGGAVQKGGLETILRQPFDDSMKGNRFTFVGTATLLDQDLKTDSVEDLEKKPVSYSGKIGWTGFEDKYFFRALVPLKVQDREILLEKEKDAVINRVREIGDMEIMPGGSVEYGYLLYFGPRDLDILKSVGHQLEAVVDFGFFDIIARPLLNVLKFFYGFVGNYGWAIILLTVAIKLLFWPLTDKSYGSMKAMQKIQPEMQKLREKYKDDKQKLNIEIMQLYRTHKVNPLGGCLPMIIQIPVFFALYKVLLEDISLRHAPFMWWIQDLSEKDPYYITPVIMGVTMFIQQKLTPTTMDSTQAKILLYMPLVFTFMFLNFPSGLVIYWLVNNLLTILQQYLINRKK